MQNFYQNFKARWPNRSVFSQFSGKCSTNSAVAVVHAETYVSIIVLRGKCRLAADFASCVDVEGFQFPSRS